MFSIKATESPGWRDFRWKASNALIALARRIYPKNPEASALMLEMMTDQMIYGQCFTQVDPTKIYKAPDHTNQRPVDD